MAPTSRAEKLSISNMSGRGKAVAIAQAKQRLKETESLAQVQEVERLVDAYLADMMAQRVRAEWSRLVPEWLERHLRRRAEADRKTAA